MNLRTEKRARFLIDTAYIAVIVILSYLIFKYVAKWVLPFILAFCIVTVIHPVINRIVRILKVKREIVSIIVMLFIYAVIGTILFLLVLRIILAVRDLFTLLPDYYENFIGPAILRFNVGFANFLNKFPEQWRSQFSGFKIDIIDSIKNFLLNISQYGITFISKLTTSIPSFMIAFIFTIMLSFFISARYDTLVLFFKTQLPPRAKKIVKEARDILVDTIFSYLRAVFTLMMITAAELWIGLMALRVPNALPIALGIAVFDALPFFGTGTIIIPWLLIELIGGNFAFAVGLLILYAIIATVREIIEPKIVGDKLGLNPIVSLCAIYLGFKTFGVLGMIIMPIIARIALSLHNKGSIRLYSDS